MESERLRFLKKNTHPQKHFLWLLKMNEWINEKKRKREGADSSANISSHCWYDLNFMLSRHVLSCFGTVFSIPRLCISSHIHLVGRQWNESSLEERRYTPSHHMNSAFTRQHETASLFLKKKRKMNNRLWIILFNIIWQQWFAPVSLQEAEQRLTTETREGIKWEKKITLSCSRSWWI